MTRHEAAILWQIVLAMRRKNYAEAEVIARTMLKATLRGFTAEDISNDHEEAQHVD